MLLFPLVRIYNIIMMNRKSESQKETERELLETGDTGVDFVTFFKEIFAK